MDMFMNSTSTINFLCRSLGQAGCHGFSEERASCIQLAQEYTKLRSSLEKHLPLRASDILHPLLMAVYLELYKQDKIRALDFCEEHCAAFLHDEAKNAALRSILPLREPQVFALSWGTLPHKLLLNSSEQHSLVVALTEASCENITALLSRVVHVEDSIKTGSISSSSLSLPFESKEETCNETLPAICAAVENPATQPLPCLCQIAVTAEPTSVALSDAFILCGSEEGAVTVEPCFSHTQDSVTNIICESQPPLRLAASPSYKKIRVCGQSGRYVGHLAPVHAVQFAHYGMVSGCAAGSVRLWQLTSQNSLRCWSGHAPLPCWTVAASMSQSALVASGGADSVVRLWNVHRFDPVRILAGHKADVDVVDFHPNEQLLVSGGADGCIRLWDLRQAVCALLFPPDTRGSLTVLRMAPNGHRLAAASDDRHVRVYELRAPQHLMMNQRRHPHTVLALAWNASGSRLASGCASARCVLWNMTNENDEKEAPLFARDLPDLQAVQALHFAENGLLLAAGQIRK